ncbi:WD40 repeat domain-containing protein [Floridanema evergladense]|uniref:WD40 repeat domain-containing protein n=1 Tax=Floridaenema evergladense BLCC-F167 TaxID=3153639 RepID=A0ABV4WT19_9CYAN
MNNTDTSIEIRAIALIPTIQTFITVDNNNVVQAWNFQGEQQQSKISQLPENIKTVILSSDGQEIATISDDNTVQLWDIRYGAQSLPFKLVGIDNIEYLVLNSKTKTLLAVDQNNIVGLYDFEGDPKGKLLRHEGQVSAIAISPDNRALATASHLGFPQGGGDTTLRLWDLEGNLLHKFEWERALINNGDGFGSFLAFSSSGKSLVGYSGYNKRLMRWAGNWQARLEIACDRLRYHPVFKNPQKGSIEEAACETCKKYVWNKADSLIK